VLVQEGAQGGDRGGGDARARLGLGRSLAQQAVRVREPDNVPAAKQRRDGSPPQLLAFAQMRSPASCRLHCMPCAYSKYKIIEYAEICHSTTGALCSCFRIAYVLHTSPPDARQGLHRRKQPRARTSARCRRPRAEWRAARAPQTPLRAAAGWRPPPAARPAERCLRARAVARCARPCRTCDAVTGATLGLGRVPAASAGAPSCDWPGRCTFGPPHPACSHAQLCCSYAQQPVQHL